MTPDYDISSPMFAHLVNVYYQRFSEMAGGDANALEWTLEGLGDNREHESYYNPRHQARFLAAIKYVRELVGKSLAIVNGTNGKLTMGESYGRNHGGCVSLRRCAIARQLLENIDSSILSLAVRKNAKTNAKTLEARGIRNTSEEEAESMIDTSEAEFFMDDTESENNAKSELEAMSQPEPAEPAHDT